MKKILDPMVLKEIEDRGVVGVIVIEDAKNAVDTAKALVEGGVTAIELALRTEAAYESIRLIKKNVPEMMIGIGTVIQPGQAKIVKELGADFAVAPGLNPSIIKEAINCNLPFAPGISTATELEKAYEIGCEFLKLFPAMPLGGIKYFNAMTGPYKYLGLKFLPLGGISQENLSQWASQKDIVAIGGSWIGKKDLINNREFDEIKNRAKKAINTWTNTKKGDSK